MCDYVVTIDLSEPQDEGRLLSALDTFALEQCRKIETICEEDDGPGIMVKTIRSSQITTKQLIFQNRGLAQAFQRFWHSQQKN